MNGKKLHGEPVLIVGNGNLTCTIAVCLLEAGFMVNLCAGNVSDAMNTIRAHIRDIEKEGRNNDKAAIDDNNLKISPGFKNADECRMAVVITAEDLDAKKDIISQLEKHLPADTGIAVNTESIRLDMIQKDALHPERVIGLNWTEPAHTTRFMEIITNSTVNASVITHMNTIARTWNKDPYIVDNLGIRSRMMGAMAREAFFLIENGYASLEDIDRACRNDAGYYLPFAGNCRYMDLMGTYAYGMVMKDLNPDLSKEQDLPVFFTEIVEKGGQGMQNGTGLYHYAPEEIKHWRKIFSEFSYRIEEIINKYPFNYKKKTG